MHAKQVIKGLGGNKLPPQKLYPLEVVALFAGQENMMLDTAKSLHLWAHCKLARHNFDSLKIMTA
jgi:hypothetical protein